MKIKPPHKDYTASFDVDSQYCFTPECPDELPVPDALAIVDELNRQAEFAKYRLGSKDAHSHQAEWIAKTPQEQLSLIPGKNMDVRWLPHAVPGTKGFELIKGLPPVTAYDFFVWKGIELDMHPYGSCYHDFAERLSTGVIEFLNSKKINTVIVGGLATDYCVKITVLQLLSAGFEVIVNLAACRGISPDTTIQAIEDMQAKGAVTIPSISAFLKEIELVEEE